MAIQIKAEGEKELSVVRQELHERDRMLDKRQDAARAANRPAAQARENGRGQPAQAGRADRGNESPQRRAGQAARPAAANAAPDFAACRRDEATRRLLEQLDGELQHEAGALIMKHERQHGRSLRGKVPRHPDHGHAALRRRRTRPKPRPAPSISPTTT